MVLTLYHLGGLPPSSYSARLTEVENIMSASFSGRPADAKGSPGLPAGIVASSVTPFTAAGEVSLEQIAPHVEWLIAEGADGLSPLGSSGEFTALETEDRKRILE